MELSVNTYFRNCGIDIFRILAALMVLTIHIGLKVNFNFDIGARGVQLFLY